MEGEKHREMSSYFIRDLDHLESLGRVFSLHSQVEHIQTLKLELMFLRTIANWIPSVPLEELFERKRRGIQEEYLSIDYSIENIYCSYMSWTANVIQASTVLERVKLIKPDAKEVYGLHLKTKYSRSNWSFQSDYVARFIDDLLENLKDLLRLKGHAITPVKKQLEDLQQKMRFLRDLTNYTAKRSKRNAEMEDLMIHIRGVTDNATILSYSCLIEEMDESMAVEVNVQLADLLQKIKPINPEVQQIYIRAFESLHPSDSWTDQLEAVSLIDFLLLDLMELIHQNSSFMLPVKDQIENLHEEMIFLKAIIMDPPVQHKTEKVKYLTRNIDEVISKAGRIIYSFSAEDTEEDTARERNHALSDLLESIKLTKADIRKINLYNFPSTDELCSIDCFLENLEELLNRRTDSIATMKHQFETIHMELLYLRSFLDKIKELRSEHDELKDLWKRVIMVVYRAEFVINSIVAGDGPAWFYMLQVSGLVEEIKLIKTEVIEIYDSKAYDTNIKSVQKISSQVSSQGTTPNIDEVMVGFEDEEKTLIERLIGTQKHRDVVTIVGMPGLGKTTIAKKLYNYPTVEQHFHVRSWCCVSQTYGRKGLLLDILGDVIELTDRIYKMSEDDLAELLYKRLKGQRYLVVLDDMWDIGAWNALKRSFPDDKNQSRIMITSRLHDVALQVTPANNVHSLRLFHDDESWMLLQEKLFHEENCPEELSEAGKQIAKNCKGLPLAVALAAGLLSRMDKKERQWKQFAETLSAHIVSDTNNQCMALLEMSYRHLPDHLKSCFLYFGAFPEDQEIPARKLTWLWIAEGFVQNTKSERLEDVAEDYLMDLIGRSLVIRSKSTSKAGVKACHVHDLLRDFCLAKAEEQNFLHLVRGYDEFFPPTDGLDYGVDSDYSNSSSLVTYEQYRLSIYSKRRHLIMARPLGPNVRSLLLHAIGDMYPNYPYDASFISGSFKLLKVLDLGCINIGDSFKGIELLVHLRYLAVKGDIESIPSSIANLWCLETFILKGLRVQFVLVPNSIWNMVRLRHLHINDHASFDLNHQILQNSSLLDNLESFSTPSLAYGDDVEKLLSKLPNLRKLSCIFLDSWDYFKGCNRFPVLKFLSQLVSLKVSCKYELSHSAQRYPCEFHFPSNLRKLTFSEFCLPWSEISSIGRLPNLEVLKLLCRAFEGKSWDMKEGQFPKLKHLKLESLNIVEWDAISDHVPCLERLVLRKCKKLLEIPPSFGDITTLQMIEVQWCSHSAAKSAINILEEQKEYGNESLKVHIYPKEQDSGESS